MISARQTRKSASVRRSMPKIRAIFVAARDAKSFGAAGASREGERLENIRRSSRAFAATIRVFNIAASRVGAKRRRNVAPDQSIFDGACNRWSLGGSHARLVD